MAQCELPPYIDLMTKRIARYGRGENNHNLNVQSDNLSWIFERINDIKENSFTADDIRIALQETIWPYHRPPGVFLNAVIFMGENPVLSETDIRVSRTIPITNQDDVQRLFSPLKGQSIHTDLTKEQEMTFGRKAEIKEITEDGKLVLINPSKEIGKSDRDFLSQDGFSEWGLEEKPENMAILDPSDVEITLSFIYDFINHGVKMNLQINFSNPTALTFSHFYLTAKDLYLDEDTYLTETDFSVLAGLLHTFRQPPADK